MTATGAVAFVDALRQRGLTVSIDASQAYVRALSLLDVASGDDVYWAGRATLIRRPDDLPDYDAAFVAHFGGLVLAPVPAPPPEPVTLITDEEDQGDGPGGDDDGDDSPSIQVRYSAVETLRTADLRSLSDEERIEAYRLIDQLRFAGRRRPSRRHRRGRGPRSRPDLGGTVRAALRTDGEALRQITTVPSERPRRLVLLVDVSGSMETYARALLRFAGAAVSARGKVEVFALGTRLTRLTRALDHHDPDRALATAAETIADFGGGTRLGESVGAFNDEWGVRGMARGATVVILSDGWDRGDPAVLGEQMGRLHRVAHEVIWVNPLRASPGYAPLAGGMAASLPHLDDFVDGHSVQALSDLADILSP